MSNELTEEGMRVNVRLLAKDNPGQHVLSEGLVDTGADVSGFEDKVLQRLGYQPVGYIDIQGATGKKQHGVYDVDFRLDGHDVLFTMRVVGMERIREEGPPFGLIGRDVLELGRMTYDGPTGIYELSFDEPAARPSTRTLAILQVGGTYRETPLGGLRIPRLSDVVT